MVKLHLPSQVDAFNKLDGLKQILRVIEHNAKLFFKKDMDLGFQKWELSGQGYT